MLCNIVVLYKQKFNLYGFAYSRITTFYVIISNVDVIYKFEFFYQLFHFWIMSYFLFAPCKDRNDKPGKYGM